MDTKVFAKFLINIIMITGSLTLGQQVDVTPQQVIARVGEPASILCRAGRQIQYCRIEIVGERVLNLAPNWKQPPGFTYNGEGLQAGQCGVTIERVKPSNHGPVRCFLGVEGDEIRGTADLVVALEPQRPQLEILSQGRNGAFEVDTEFQAKCISHDGRPPANITWYLDDEPLFDGLTMPEVVETHDRNNATLYTVVQGIQRFIRVDDDRRNLICRANHFSYPQGYLDSRIQLLVRYRPQPLPLVKLYGLILGSTGLINVTIRANPRPLSEWHVSGMQIQQGTRNGRYEAYEPQDLGRGEFNVALSIAGLTLEDTTKDYLLRASNEFGTQDYQVRISSSEAAPAAGLGVGPIIGIVVGVLVILIIIGLIVVARATGRWCFSDNSAPRPSETSDTESVENRREPLENFTPRPTPQKLIKPNLSLNAIFKRNKSPSTVKHEALESQPQQTGATPAAEDDQHPRDSEETVIITDEVTEPKEEDSKPNIVYAELMLKPSQEGKAPPQKTPTEYAEIVYPKTQKATSTKNN
ncbi:fasciclin-3 isoform X1 [Phlebotomus papatasi]|uniref:fasciclin-3 isoform X1 n=1 Tax=Phlebotomus papatasi TaxID=29031 RepID=UPI00248467C6|nr:fasciclin-3 isoform X1 [Phlebotomus papatasi]